MTREEIKKIVEGITDEQLKAILDINSADIGKAKKDYDTIKSENDTLKADKKSLEDKICSGDVPVFTTFDMCQFIFLLRTCKIRHVPKCSK